MTKRRVIFVVLLAALGAFCHGQSWMAAYEKGIKTAGKGDWMGARAAFQQDVAYRPDDFSGPTTLPGPVTDRREWREGAPYSPNFLAAYCEYRIGIGASKPEDGRPVLVAAAQEFEALLAKG